MLERFFGRKEQRDYLGYRKDQVDKLMAVVGQSHTNPRSFMWMMAVYGTTFIKELQDGSVITIERVDGEEILFDEPPALDLPLDQTNEKIIDIRNFLKK